MRKFPEFQNRDWRRHLADPLDTQTGMKLNISFPATGCQKLIEVDDERKLCTFYEKRRATEVAADALGEEWKGYVVRISGRNDKQGFPVKQGVLTHGRVRLLLKDDVRQYVVRKPLNKDGKKPRTKATKIQRLVTPRVLQHKWRRIARKKQRTKENKEEAAEYAKLLAKRMKEAKQKRQEQIAKRRRLSSLRASTSESRMQKSKRARIGL
ncbi:hypothetical protein MG293_020301 [Ovis ammon polii]|uniref:40S ribosomal protein S6 n=1 Tax=Ovis ammon polii TaxID=230172 RepID=A0AAD4TK67_OVIAM|nr:hypothetical protein MG293_020301 [Ovis ammon polii]